MKIQHICYWIHKIIFIISISIFFIASLENLQTYYPWHTDSQYLPGTITIFCRIWIFSHGTLFKLLILKYCFRLYVWSLVCLELPSKAGNKVGTALCFSLLLIWFVNMCFSKCMAQSRWFSWTLFNLFNKSSLPAANAHILAL